MVINMCMSCHVYYIILLKRIETQRDITYFLLFRMSYLVFVSEIILLVPFNPSKLTKIYIKPNFGNFGIHSEHTLLSSLKTTVLSLVKKFTFNHFNYENKIY